MQWKMEKLRLKLIFHRNKNKGIQTLKSIEPNKYKIKE